MQTAITQLKTEKTNLNQHLLDLKRRVAELELMIGDDHNWRLIIKFNVSKKADIKECLWIQRLQQK